MDVRIAAMAGAVGALIAVAVLSLWSHSGEPDQTEAPSPAEASAPPRNLPPRRPRLEISADERQPPVEPAKTKKPAETAVVATPVLPENFEWHRHDPYEGSGVWTVSSSGISEALEEAMVLTGTDCRELAELDGEVVFDVVVFNAEGRGITYAAGIMTDDADHWEESANVDMINCQNEQLRRLQFEPPPPGEIFRFDVPISLRGNATD